MSATIYWKPLGDGMHIDVAAPSAFIQAMTVAFGSYPWRLNKNHIERLSGMAAMNTDGAKRNPFEAVIDAINQSGFQGIELWPEY